MPLLARALLLRVTPDGVGTSIVVRMLDTNTVLKCAVSFIPFTHTQNEPPQGVRRPQQLAAGQKIELRVLSCAPPVPTVCIHVLEHAIEHALEHALEHAPDHALEEHAQPQPPPAPAGKRKRPFFALLQDTTARTAARTAARTTAP